MFFLDIKKNQKIKNLIMIKKEHFSRQWNSFTLAKTDNFRQFGGRILFTLQFKQQHLGIGENLQFLDNR